MSLPTFDKFEQYAKTSVHRVGLALEPPDGDWAPMLIGVGANEKMVFCPLTDIPPQDRPAVIRGMASKVGLQLAFTVMSSWMARTGFNTEEEANAAYAAGYTVTADPERVEVVLLCVADAEHEVWWEAPILRNRLQIVLGEWEARPVVSGRMVGVLQAACRG